MAFELCTFEARHYRAARTLWECAEGVGLSDADEEPAILAYLARNPRTSFVALDAQDALVGTVLCGHDGRRGLIHHLAVAEAQRRQGIGQALVRAGLQALRAEGIQKCHLLVFTSNTGGLAFWTAVGAQVRDELELLSLATPAAR